MYTGNVCIWIVEIPEVRSTVMKNWSVAKVSPPDQFWQPNWSPYQFQSPL